MEAELHRPLGDLLEEILDRGPGSYPRYLRGFPEAPRTYRLAVLLGGLCLGPDVVEVFHEWVARPDSPAKQGVLLGLGAIGHPLAEGYLVRVCRERPSLDAAITALQGLARIRGPKSLPLVVRCLDHPFLKAQACQTLAAYGGSDAEQALLDLGEDDPDAVRALARMGAPGGRERFLAALKREPPWPAWGAEGIGRLGDPELGERLTAFLCAEDEEVRRAAWEAYVRLGAPAGVEPLLEAAGDSPEGWMLEALGRAPDPRVQEYAAGFLSRPARGGWLRRLFRKTREGADPLRVIRALRHTCHPGAMEHLVRRLQEAEGPELRELLLVRGFREDPRYVPDLEGVWRRGALLPAYLAARCLAQVPSTQFLREALEMLGRPGLVREDELPPGGDPERLLEALAADTNPVVDLASFLDSGLVDLDALEENLRQRMASGAFPPGGPARGRLTGPEEQGLAGFLDALAAAHPSRRHALDRMWALLARVDDRGDPVLELFVCWGGEHRGGLQRALYQALPSSLGTWIQGRTDRDLPDLDTLAAAVPDKGPLAGPLRELLERTRRALQAECRDMVLMLEGAVRGDMVLIEAL